MAISLTVLSTSSESTWLQAHLSASRKEKCYRISSLLVMSLGQCLYSWVIWLHESWADGGKSLSYILNPHGSGCGESIVFFGECQQCFLSCSHWRSVIVLSSGSKECHQKTSQSDHMTTDSSNSMKLGHAMRGHPRRTGHGGEVWQNVVHWRREWQSTSVFLPWEPHEQYEKAKR